MEMRSVFNDGTANAIEFNICSECLLESYEALYRGKKPFWLSKDDKGEFACSRCPEFALWSQESQRRQRCLVVRVMDDSGVYEPLVLCSKHLRALADKIDQ
jgi:hypothetical protein